MTLTEQKSETIRPVIPTLCADGLKAAACECVAIHLQVPILLA